MDFTSQIGSRISGFNQLVLGAPNLANYVVVTWIKNSDLSLGTTEIDFGYDESGQKIVLKPNVPTVLTRTQAQQAEKEGAVLVGLGSF